MVPSLRKPPFAALACALAAPLASHAVTLNPDGLGQALIYPYYTVQSDAGNAWNTYVTVVNHTSNAKAVRVRFREGRNARPVLNFNLYLSPNDAWAAALIAPTSATGPARLVTVDTSCTSPPIPATSPPPGIDFGNASYSGVFSDGFGEGLDRTREGFIEIIEMATLTGPSATAVTHNSAGIPANCARMQGDAAVDANPPTGGLSGTLTLINVNSGMDFNANAEALAQLSTSPFYRPANDPYPDFNAAEIEAASTVVANGKVYYSTWTRPVDAVSAVLMRTEATAEYVLDPNTHSRTDHVVTFPTRSFYMQGSVFSAPFDWPRGGTSSENFTALVTDRNASRYEFTCVTTLTPTPPCRHEWAWAANVMAISRTPLGSNTSATSLLGSTNGWTAEGRSALEVPMASTVNVFENGAITYRIAPTSFTLYRILISKDAALRFDPATSQFLTGAHTFRGLPLVAMQLRTFENGTLSCSGGGRCQGNYGGSFPAAYQRSVTP